MTELSELLVLARHHRHPSDRVNLDRAVRTGRLTRICEGAYVDSTEWGALGDTRRHLLVAHAAQHLRRRRLVFSHWTAAAAWDLPILDALPADAHVVAPEASGGRSDERLVRHCVGIPQRTVRREGLEVTTLARTIVDLARVAPFPSAVVAADAGLARDPSLDVDVLASELGPRGARGIARAERVIAFADGESGSPGESLSRTSIAAAGLPAPVLQQRFEDERGVMVVDFWWPEFNLIGEFDGAVKYDDIRFLAGRTPHQALLDEKDREDRLRALGPRVVRWRWATAASPARLGALLRSAGVRPERYRTW